MSNKPFITVFTPAYNRAHTIGRTYESLKTCKKMAGRRKRICDSVCL